jgi:hypothetical protein
MQESAGDEEKLQIGKKGKLLVSLAADNQEKLWLPDRTRQRKQQ